MGQKMSFFLPNHLTCFLCNRTIGQRVEAAQLLYAHPDDVGDLARYGRAWVHRTCWTESVLRGPWAASALRLLESDTANLSMNDVVCRINGNEVLLQDPWQAVTVNIPVDCITRVIDANERGGELRFKSTRWELKLVDNMIKVTGDTNEEPFESFSQPPARWSPALIRALAGKIPGSR